MAYFFKNHVLASEAALSLSRNSVRSLARKKYEMEKRSMPSAGTAR